MEGAVIEEMLLCMETLWGNPSSVHEAGRRSRVAVENARRKVAGFLKVAPSELFFCSGGTEGNNAILWGAVRDLGCRHLITCATEHPAVLKTAENIARQGLAEVHHVCLDAKGHPSTDHLSELLSAHPGALVSLMHANNETGNLLPVKAVAELCRKHHALFHSDTVQSIGKFHMDMQKLSMDFAVASAHKFHGPKGVGFMVVRQGHFFKAYIDGGGQERLIRAGTENVCGIVGMAKALELAHASMERDQEHITGLKEACIRLLREKVAGCLFNGDAEGSSLHTILNVSLPPALDAEILLPRLDIAGICVSSGSACASGAHKGSHVLAAMGVDTRLPSLRISFSRHNTMDEVKQLATVLAGIT